LLERIELAATQFAGLLAQARERTNQDTGTGLASTAA
jgi:hypothetical protein